MTDILQMKFDAAKAAKTLGLVAKEQQAKLLVAVHATTKAAAVEIKKRAEADILSAGKFSARWPNALQAVPEDDKDQSTIKVFFDSSIPYAHVHEFGAVIRGKPLLWIPLPWNAHKVRARDFPGQLFRVNRVGKHPLLMSKEGAQYVGVEQVILRPRFHIRSIVANVVRTQLAKMFFSFLRQG
jgi:hypothetical protein